MPKKYYKVKIWCDDCLTVGDDMGCFCEDGGIITLDEDYKSYDLAETAAKEYIGDCDVWRYEIVEGEYSDTFQHFADLKN